MGEEHAFADFPTMPFVADSTLFPRHVKISNSINDGLFFFCAKPCTRGWSFRM